MTKPFGLGHYLGCAHYFLAGTAPADGGAPGAGKRLGTGQLAAVLDPERPYPWP